MRGARSPLSWHRLGGFYPQVYRAEEKLARLWGPEEDARAGDLERGREALERARRALRGRPSVMEALRPFDIFHHDTAPPGLYLADQTAARGYFEELSKAKLKGPRTGYFHSDWTEAIQRGFSTLHDGELEAILPVGDGARMMIFSAYLGDSRARKEKVGVLFESCVFRVISGSRVFALACPDHPVQLGESSERRSLIRQIRRAKRRRPGPSSQERVSVSLKELSDNFRLHASEFGRGPDGGPALRFSYGYYSQLEWEARGSRAQVFFGAGAIGARVESALLSAELAKVSAAAGAASSL